MSDPKNTLHWGTTQHRVLESPRHGTAVGIESDYHGWLLNQASSLRERRVSSIDWIYLAEELEAMASAERRTLKKQLKRLLMHLLKMRAQPSQTRRHGGWRKSIRDAREELEDLIADSPGIFQGKRDEVLAQVYERAREAAVDETKLPLKDFPAVCPWTFEEILQKDFFPAPSQAGRLIAPETR